MSKKNRPAESASVVEVRPTHERVGGSTQGMTLARGDTLVVNYRLDVLGRDLHADREAAIEMYAQMAAKRMREMLDPIRILDRPDAST